MCTPTNIESDCKDSIWVSLRFSYPLSIVNYVFVLLPLSSKGLSSS